ncbi:Methylamine utilization protein mauE [Novosphingobium nitrogenifigens DSM 19370]|uniref:Methylamine utilization protein MauE n=1 Tax=Novosphingobium nitrogenifigens DSM 19370 TaxID=983920 RepID=F1Z7Y7_9SPHN|nr:MauE/DoxX family redox-associated membrane protein [Novosphingobium nitrogenifigens]EGD59238.1 Methylamine utilization protein mauE [Novosphingobium nitrogenifigens DSM 19370]
MNSILVETGLAGAVGTGIVFAGAGLAKLRHRELFPGVVANYRLLPPALEAPVALLLPFVEVVLGVGLIASGLTGGKLAWLGWPAAALFLGFAAAMAINIRRGRAHIDCGCGRSQLRQPLSWGLVVRNGVLAALAVCHAVAGAPATAPDAAGLAVALVAGLALYLFTLLFNALAALAASPLASGRR